MCLQCGTLQSELSYIVTVEREIVQRCLLSGDAVVRAVHADCWWDGGGYRELPRLQAEQSSSTEPVMPRVSQASWLRRQNTKKLCTYEPWVNAAEKRASNCSLKNVLSENTSVAERGQLNKINPNQIQLVCEQRSFQLRTDRKFSILPCNITNYYCKEQMLLLLQIKWFKITVFL